MAKKPRSTTYAKKLEAAIERKLSREVDQDKIAPYLDKPVRFASDFLGIIPWTRQAECLQAIAKEPRVAIRSGHKTGKSELLGCAAIWFCMTRPGARVVITNPTGRQIRQVTYKAVRRLSASRSLVDYVANISLLPEHGVTFRNTSEIIGFSADNAESFAGISGADLMFIVDEASGMETPIMEAIEGSAAGGATIVLAGNPTKTSGAFYDAFHNAQDFWSCIHVSSEETPNVVEGRRVIPGLAGRDWVESRKADWGEQSPLYAVRVRGDFPAQGSNAVMGIDMIERARHKWGADSFLNSTARTVIGVDPARFGNDESVIFAVRGQACSMPVCYRGLDSIQLANRVMVAAQQWAKPHEIPLVRVDSIGIGAGVLDQLRTFDSIHAVGVNAGEGSQGNYNRKRDELWFGILDWLKSGGELPPDNKLHGELAGAEYGFLPSGKIKVMDKEEMRDRLGRSPDRADALALACWSNRALVTLGDLSCLTAGERRVDEGYKGFDDRFMDISEVQDRDYEASEYTIRIRGR